MSTMFGLQDRVALVTGGARGIGRAIAEHLAQQGAYVAINYVSNEQAAAQCLEAVRKAGGDGELLRFDVADAAAVDKAIDGLVSSKGKLDILVNNAGIAVDQLLLRLKPEELQRTWATNVNGSIYCAKAAIRSMMRKRYGRIIQLSSVVAEAGNPGQAAYSSSKAALIGLTKTLAREYASRGITVNAVAPGYIDTDMTSSLSDDVKKAITAETPLGRVGSAHEVAAAVTFLASSEASYITGQVLRVNGGMYM